MRPPAVVGSVVEHPIDAAHRAADGAAIQHVALDLLDVEVGEVAQA